VPGVIAPDSAKTALYGFILECGAFIRDRRILQRLGRCDRGVSLFRLHRHRYTRLDPVSIDNERRHGSETNVGRCEQMWHLSACSVDG
jgi:hypothetical protein